MRITAFDGYPFAANGYSAGVDWLWGQWQIVPNEEQRLNAPPLLTGGTISTRAIPVEFSHDGSGGLTWEQAALTLMARLNPMSTAPRPLLAELNDGTEVSCEAVVQVMGARTGDGSVNWIEVVFITADPFWTETADTVQTLTGLSTSNDADTLTNNGATTVSPILTVQNRSIHASAQLDRFQITVTNGAELPLEREVITTVIPYNAAIATNAALVKDGTYHPVNFHTPGASINLQYAAFPVTVDPGEAEVFDLISRENPAGDLNAFTRFNGNYAAPDLTFESHDITSATSTTVTVAGANWPVNRWAGACMRVENGSGSNQGREILSNTANVLTVRRAFATTPSGGNRITLIGSGYYTDGGVVSSATTTTLTDGSQSWVPGSLVGLKVIASGNDVTITNNTATMLTFDPPISPALTAGATYRIRGSNYHRYYVDQIKHSERHRGGWQVNKRFTQPSKVLWGADILNGWEPFLLTENSDDYNQVRWTEVLLGGSDPDYWPMLNATRRRGSDRGMQEKRQFDGVAVYDPLGYQAIRFDYQFQNQNGATGATKGITKFVLAGREPGGDEFEPYVTDDTLRATLTNVAAQNVDLRNYGNPTQLYMGLMPRTGNEISRDALESDEANVRWHQTLRMWLNIRDRLTISTSSVQAVTAVEDEIRIGDLALQVGMRDGQRLYVRATDALIFDCARARASVDDGAGNLTDITYAVTPWDYANNRIADKWPVLEPGANTLTITSDVWALGGSVDIEATFREAHFG